MIPAATTPDTATRTVRRLSVVVADDVEEITLLARQWLEGAGHTVACVDCGDAAVRLLKREHVDVMVADILMPDGDGLDVIVAARRISPDTRLLAISGGGKYMSANDCLRIAKGVGADRILMKPFSRAQLVSAVEELGAQG